MKMYRWYQLVVLYSCNVPEGRNMYLINQGKSEKALDIMMGNRVRN